MVYQSYYITFFFPPCMHTFALYVLLAPHCYSEFVFRPGMNSCDISEDETTKAVQAFYQLPISECQNNMQTHATGTAIGVSSADSLQFGLNHKKSSSDVLPDGVKKKHVVKEKTMSGINNDVLQFSNSAKINAQVSGNNRSLNDMNQQPADSNPMKKMGSKQSSRFNNIVEEKHVPKKNDKQVNGGTSFILEIFVSDCNFLFVNEQL